jgi:hypothetical protein
MRAGIPLLLSLAVAAAAGVHSRSGDEGESQAGLLDQFINRGCYSLHLENSLRFNVAHPAGDVDQGRTLFGLAPDLETEHSSGALFDGFSIVALGPIVSNGRTTDSSNYAPTGSTRRGRPRIRSARCSSGGSRRRSSTSCSAAGSYSMVAAD